MKPVATITQSTHAQTDAQVLTIWLAGKAQSTQETYGIAAKQFLNHVGKELREMVLEDLQGWVQFISRRYHPHTVKVKTNAVKSLFTFGQKIGYLQFNLGSAVSPPPAKENLAERILDQEDIKQLIEAASNERDRALLMLLYGCGLRVSEACGLTWRDLQKRSQGGQATIFGKGGKTRVVLIPLVIWDLINRLPRSEKSEAVFTSRTGRKLERTMVHKLIKKYAEKAGINPHVSAHWLRHAHATYSLEGGCDLHLLQQSLGHSSLAVTSKYLHVRPDQGSSQYLGL